MRCYVHEDLGEPGEVCPGLPDWVLMWGVFPTLLPSHSPGTERQDCPPSCSSEGVWVSEREFQGFGIPTSTSSLEVLLGLPPESSCPFVFFFWGPQGWPAWAPFLLSHHQQMGIRWGEGEGYDGRWLARLSPMFSLQGVVIKLLILPVPEVGWAPWKFLRVFMTCKSQRAG